MPHSTNKIVILKAKIRAENRRVRLQIIEYLKFFRALTAMARVMEAKQEIGQRKGWRKNYSPRRMRWEFNGFRWERMDV